MREPPTPPATKSLTLGEGANTLGQLVGESNTEWQEGRGARGKQRQDVRG